MFHGNETTMRRFIEKAINQGNLHLIDEVVHPNYVYRSPNQTLHGPQALRDLFTAYRAAFPDLYLEIDELLAAGDRILIRFTLSGTHQGEFMGTAATGRRMKVNGTTFSRFEAGRIIEEWELLDELTLTRQLGIAPVQSPTNPQQRGQTNA